jgi:4-alpha-glucanotransferase
MNRASGLFLHPTSLPSQFGIGDIGHSAYKWVDMLAKMKQTFWQMCPLGPTGYGDSPYQSLCSFAGNTLVISPVLLKETGLLTDEEIAAFPVLSADHVDYGTVIIEKEKLYKKAYARFVDTKEFTAFCTDEHYWLDNFALYKVLKDLYGGLPWYSWDVEHKLRFPAVLEEVVASQRKEIRYQKFLQFLFHQQWSKLKKYANGLGVKIIGDLPIYIAYDSSDTWASPEMFELDEHAKPIRVAGVPPDYFSETGQLWGNPLYHWKHMKQDGYSWWIRRIKKALELVDYMRLDHFRGFEAYWAVNASHKTAVKGEWVKGPGIDLFKAIKKELGKLPIIAEDLGVITLEVETLRKNVGLPGMKVLQFAFDGNPENPYLPYNTTTDSVLYTGTHDNDTSLGWFNNLLELDKHLVRKYLGCADENFLEKFLRLAFGAPSKLCIIPFQDVLGLDSKHRMNIPGKESGNWQWRFTFEQVDPDKIQLFTDFTSVYGRECKKEFSL